MKEKIRAIREMFERNHMYPEVYQCGSLPVVCVEIEWGDWKHDHDRADYLMKWIGGVFIKKEVTAEDGSDCYSAKHYYTV